MTATAGCTTGYLPPDRLRLTAPTASAMALTYTTDELALWRSRAASGPFVVAGDYAAGSPGDWARIVANARAFVRDGEAVPAAVDIGQDRATHGTRARDAAFHYLMTGDAASLAAVRNYLMAQALSPSNDFTGLCIRFTDGSTRDAWYGEAGWLLRHIVAYDHVRAALTDGERLTIENWIRRNAYFFAAHTDWGLVRLFPKRLAGDYTVKASDAATTTDAAWLSQRTDTNGDCALTAADDAAAYPVYAYARGDGTNGPRVSVLSQWFNNRKSVTAAAFGAAGVLLGDAELTKRAERYFMEWLTYAVWADGSEGEYARNGDYCVPRQGVIYAASNIQGALMLGDWLARRGDDGLFAFSTAAGLHGTQTPAGGRSKSLELVASTHLKLLTRQLDWYRHEGQLAAAQRPREATHLGRMEANVYGAARTTDNYHELGLLVAARRLPNVALTGLALRDPAVTTLRFPGSTGNAVAAGWGSWAGSWNDAFNAYPAMLLTRN